METEEAEVPNVGFLGYGCSWGGEITAEDGGSGSLQVGFLSIH